VRAAFDRGLVTSPTISEAARKTLGVDAALPLRGLRDAHRANLGSARHRFAERGEFNAAAGLL